LVTDGTRIAILQSGGAGHFQLWTEDPDGGNQQLVYDDTTFLYAPDWAPDGSAIIFSHGDGTTVPNQLYSVKPDGTDVKPLTSVGRNDYGTWSPDGSKIAFSSSRGGFWLMNPDGTGQTRVKKLGMEFSVPAWQPVNLVLHSSRGKVTFGDSVKLTAHLVPFASSTNQTVALYALPAGGSKTLLASGTVNSSGNFSATTHPKKNTRYVAEWAGDAEHLGGGVGEAKVGVHTRVEGVLRNFDG
jgi:hypothetical protein